MTDQAPHRATSAPPASAPARPVRAAPTAGRKFYGWRIVRTLAVTETISWGILYYAFTVLLVPMRDDLGFSTATLTGAFSLAIAVTGLAGLPVGRWVDRHGVRALMTVGSIAAVALVLAWSRVQTVTGLYLVVVGLGLVSAAVLYEPAFAVVRWFHAHRARALLGVTVVAGFASTIFLPATQALEQSFGWRNTLVVLAAVLAVGTVLPHALVLHRDPADLGLAPDGTAPATWQSRARPDEATSPLSTTARRAFCDRTFRLLTLGSPPRPSPSSSSRSTWSRSCANTVTLRCSPQPRPAPWASCRRPVDSWSPEPPDAGAPPA